MLLEQTVNKANQLWKPVGKTIGKVLVKRLLGIPIEEIGELFNQSSVERTQADNKASEEITNALSEAYDSSLKDHINQKQAVLAFKAKLSLLIEFLEKSQGVKLPVFFFVDELDRIAGRN